MAGACWSLAAPLVIALGLSLPLGSRAQFNFHFNPGRIASSLAKREGQQVAQVLSGKHASKTIAKALKAGTEVAAGTVADDVLKGFGASAGEGAPANATGAAAAATTPLMPPADAQASAAKTAAAATAGTAVGDSTATAGDEQPPQAPANPLLRGFGGNLGGTLAKAAKALDHVKPGDLQKEIEKDASVEVASELKPLTEALEQKSPQLAEALRKTDPKKVEEVLKGTDPKDIQEVLSAYERIHWMRAHWPLLAASLAGAILVFACCAHAVRRLVRPRRKAEALLMETEINMWMRTTTGARPLSSGKETQEELEAPELGFQQF